METQFFVELLPALFWKKDAGALQFNAAASAGNVGAEPVRPFNVEVDVVGSPNDKRRSVQRFEAIFDCKCVFVIEGCEEALQIVETLVSAKKWAQVRFDAFVAQLFGMFVSRA